MISKQMYKVLNEIPHSPATITYQDIKSKAIVDDDLLKDILAEAKNSKYVKFGHYMPYNDILLSKFALTEEGQVAIEEYEGTKYNTKLSTWALVISGLSFLASVAAVVVACVV